MFGLARLWLWCCAWSRASTAAIVPSILELFRSLESFQPRSVLIAAVPSMWLVRIGRPDVAAEQEAAVGVGVADADGGRVVADADVDAEVDGCLVGDLKLALQVAPGVAGEPGLVAGCPLVEVEAAEVVFAQAGVVQLLL